MYLDVTHSSVLGRQEIRTWPRFLGLQSVHVGSPFMSDLRKRWFDWTSCVDLPVWVCFGMIRHKDPASLRTKMRGININMACVETNCRRTPHPTCGGQKSGYHPPGREAYCDETTSEALVTTVRSAMRGTSSLAPIVS